MFLSFHSGCVGMSHSRARVAHGSWATKVALGCQEILVTEILSPVRLSTAASGRKTILQGLSAFPSLPQVICHITGLAVTILVVSPNPKTCPLTRSLWRKPGT